MKKRKLSDWEQKTLEWALSGLSSLSDLEFEEIINISASFKKNIENLYEKARKKDLTLDDLKQLHKNLLEELYYRIDEQLRDLVYYAYLNCEITKVEYIAEIRKINNLLKKLTLKKEV